jgi:preprotein translocase subunit SecG
MLYGLLITLYLIIGFLLVLIIFVQKGKGSLGLGNIGGGTQMLFGGSGGQDLFQKATWILGALFMAGSLILSVYKTSSLGGSRYLSTRKNIPAAAHNLSQAEQSAETEQPVNQ